MAKTGVTGIAYETVTSDDGSLPLLSPMSSIAGQLSIIVGSYNLLKHNKGKKFVIFDIPLLLENKINKKGDILIYIDSRKNAIFKRLKKRRNFDYKLFRKFKSVQLPLDYKKKKSQFIIKNDFTKKTVTKYVKYILQQIQKWKK